mmetsp:Transcript_46457/g.91688  ORF Transcript_46457/g.91688 Transcript_46457/m.91688 type:complete len:96 (+) Transcript_46457:661-948(+)
MRMRVSCVCQGFDLPSHALSPNAYVDGWVEEDQKHRFPPRLPSFLKAFSLDLCRQEFPLSFLLFALWRLFTAPKPRDFQLVTYLEPLLCLLRIID